MTYERLGPRGLDYMPCRYGTSRILFRGPRPDLRAPYLVFLGGTEVYGKFMPTPLPVLVAEQTGLGAVNLGALNAGPDLYLNDPTLLSLTGAASATVIQIMGAQNVANRYYSVHPRHNDRFLNASALLKTIYRDVDFARYHYTRHMLSDLYQLSPERFEILRIELQQAWVARMHRLLDEVTGPVILHWFATHSPDYGPGCDGKMGCRGNPLFITREMIADLAPRVAAVVESTPSAAARAQRTEGLIFSQMEAPMADTLLGLPAHREAARDLVAALTALEGHQTEKSTC